MVEATNYLDVTCSDDSYKFTGIINDGINEFGSKITMSYLSSTGRCRTRVEIVSSSSLSDDIGYLADSMSTQL